MFSNVKMNFEERINLKAVRWLIQQFNEEFIKTNIPVEEQERFKYQYANIKKILLNYDKNNGIHKTVYSKSATDVHQILRDYAPLSIQGLPTYFRGLICKDIMTDIDMKNCHPSIIYGLCKKYGIECKYLEEYCLHRKSLLDSGMANKIDIIASINKHTPLKKSTPFMSAFDTEMKQIQQQFMKHDDFKTILKISQDACSLKKDYKKHNIAGTFMSYLATSYEVKFLHSLIPFIRDKGIEIGVLMFDGLMVYGEQSEQLLLDMSQHIQDTFGFQIEFTMKPLETGNLYIPPNWVEPDLKSNYDILKHKYETDFALAYIVSLASYSYKLSGSIQFFKQHEMKQHLQPIKIKNKSFFDEWCNDVERATYDNVDIIPHDRKCPPTTLNLWTGFYAERITQYEKVDIQFLLDHIKIMCNHNDSYYQFVLDWIANRLQYPSSTTLLLNFYTEAGGTGKGSLIDIIKAMIGKDKYLLIDDITRLFGRFNDMLKGIILCHFDEMSSKELNPYYERLKALITSDDINIETKGQKAYTIKNTIGYISTTQHALSFKIKGDDRRIWTVESSSELKKNIEYFDKLRQMIEDDNAIRSLYDFFMSRPVKKQLTERDYPVTQLMEDAITLNRDPIEDFMIQLQDGEYTSEELYVSYKQYIQMAGLEFVISLRQFQYKFSKLIEKYDIEKVKLDNIVEGKRLLHNIYIKGEGKGMGRALR